MAEGIVFGGYLLSKEDFIPIFEQWYEQKGEQFVAKLKALESEIKVMIIREMSPSSSNPNISKLRTHRTAEYNAALVYQKWEEIQKEYFGNDAVTLIAITQFEDEQMTWSQNIDESQFVTASGINVSAAQFQKVARETMNAASTLAAAEEVQNFLRLHYAQLCTQLVSYKINVEEAAELHKRIPKKSALYTNRHEHFTGRSYEDIIFASQGNAEGKRLDAFMNHIGQYNKQIFSLMNSGVANKESLERINNFDTHGAFSEIFNSPSIVQPWLLASLNTTSWLTGGDVIVVDDNGAIIYNIQIKSTSGGKNFELALNRLLSLLIRIIRKTESTRFKPKQLAQMMYNSLKTTSANDIARTENFIESKAYEMVLKNLKLSY